MRDYAELITRLKQSDDNCNAECCECSGECLSSGCNIFSEAADAIEELLAAVPKWISVEERLPSRYETVLLNIQTCKDSYVTIGDYEPNELRFRDFADRNNQVYCGDIVTHWMPLPAPPKEVQDG